MEYGTVDYYNGRLGALKTERESWMSHWRDISEFMMPRLSRFLVSDRNRGEKKNSKIIDNTATLSLRTSSAGMVEGLTSRARPWFQLRAPDPGLNDFRAIKVWLDLVDNRMREILLKSNFYTVVPLTRTDLLAYGTSAYAVLSDDQDLIRCYHFPIGSYCLASSPRGIVDTCYREFNMTARQLVEQFGEANCSQTVKSLVNQKGGSGLETWVPVVHAVEPNRNYEPRRQQFSAFKRFHSCYYEPGANENKKLKESGFDRMRILAPRWMVTGEDVYASCPGMEVLGDTRGLQHQQKRKQQLIDKGISPAMGAPPSLKEGRASLLPGDVTFYDLGQNGQKFEPLYDVSRFQYQWLLQDITETQQRIRRGLFEDLFLMFAGERRAQPPTAEEISKRYEEKLWMLGPIIVRDNDENLEPLIDIVFEEMLANGLVPEAPPELQGMQLGVEFISVLAQALKLAGVIGLERGVGFITGLAGAGKMDAMDMLDTYETVTAHWDMVGAPPKPLRDKKMFEAIQQKKLEQQNAAQMGAMVKPAADTAKTLSETKLEDDNALTRMAAQIQGIQGNT